MREPAGRLPGERRLFLAQFLRQGRAIAAPMPSSPALAAAMCAGIDPTRPQTILELGAGTGAVTREIARRMHPQSRLIALEADPTLAALIRECAPAAAVLLGDVRDISRLLADVPPTEIDSVLSGLPIPSLPRAVNGALLEWLAQVPTSVPIEQLTLMPGVYYRVYRRLFREVRFEFVPASLPPGGVYHCRGLRGDFHRSVPGR